MEVGWCVWYYNSGRLSLRQPNGSDVVSPLIPHLNDGWCNGLHSIVTRVERSASAATLAERETGWPGNKRKTSAPPRSLIWGWRPRGITTRSAGRGGELSSRGSTRRQVGAGLRGDRSFYLHAC
eukprot:364156-Chlamydomonas_euryale.AAC.6